MRDQGGRRGGGCAGVPWLLALAAAFGPAPLLAADQPRPVFSQERFDRTGGSPNVYERGFVVPAYVGPPFSLHLINGNPDGSARVAIEDAVSSGRVLVDGVEVVAPSAFSKTTPTIDRTLTLAPGPHRLRVELASAPGSYLRLSISGVIPLGDLTQPRSGHTATLLPDGQGLVTGGGAGAEPLATTERFDGATLQSTPLELALLTARRGHRATLLPDASLLVTGGADALGPLPSAEHLRRDLGAADPLPAGLHNARAGHSATLLPDGRVLLLGGLDVSHVALTEGEHFDARPSPLSGALYDPQSGAVTPLPDALQVPRTAHTATLLPNGLVLVAGGRNGTADLASAELFDPATGHSTLLAATLTTPRAGHAALLQPDGSVLLIGGRQGDTFLGSMERFLPPTQTFAPVAATLRIARAHHTATRLPSGEILVAGGEGAGGVLAHTELLGPPPPDGTAPLVAAVSPAPDATFVPRNPLLTVLASEPLLATSVTTATVTLSGPGGLVPARVAPAEEGLLVVLAPSVRLEPGTTYTLTLAGLTDVAGTGLPTTTSRFTTVPLPVLTGFVPTSGRPGTHVTVTGQGFDPTDLAHNRVAFAGTPAVVTGVTATSLTALVPETAQSGPLTVTTPGGTATSAQPFTVIRGPVLASLSPASGPVGTTVTISGRHFDPSPGNNQVRFNGKAALVTAATDSALTALVPQGATSGPVTVTTTLGTGASPEAFTVTLARDFSLIAAPAAPAVATTVQGGVVAYALAVSGLGGFAGAVTLGVSGLPSGVMAQFSAPALAPGQQGFVTFLTSPFTPPGAFPVTLTGTALLETGARTQSVPLTLQVLAQGGQTAVSGQMLRVDGTPIPDVIVKVQTPSGPIQTQADAAGNFLLQQVPAGTVQLMIDANAAVPGYPMYAADVVATAGQVTVLPPFRITPPPPPERFTPIANGSADQVITDPRFPGVAITLPAGVTITGWDGVLKTRLAVERLTPDRLPVPPPPGPTRSLYQLFFGTPMGGVPSAPIPIALPNDLDLDPGDEAELWYYDASPMGGPGTWRLAGTGTVSPDGSRIVSNPGVGIQRFCGVCGLACFVSRQQKQPNNNPSGPAGGDPVKLGIGVFTVEKTDLVLPGRLPVAIGRTYNPFDPFGTIGGYQPPLGPGWALSIDPILIPGIAFRAQSPDIFRLVLPGNTRLDLTRNADGTFTNKTHPLLDGAVLTQLSTGQSAESLLRWKDGTVWRFRRTVLNSFGAALDFLIEIADRNGNRTAIERDFAGAATRVVDAAGRAIQLTRSGGRVTEVRDPLGRTVHYGYDADGRLATVTDPAGGVTRYAYDAAGRILTITDPRNIPFVRNVYGDSGRILRQLLPDGAEWRFRYRLSGATVTGPGCPTATSGTIVTLDVRVSGTVACPSEESWEAVQAGYSFAGGAVLATTLVDPRGHATTYAVTPDGFTQAVTDPLGQVTRSERDGQGRLTAVVDPLGRRRTFAYDAAGNVTAVTDAAGQVTRLEYEPSFHRVTRITDPLGRSATFAYDARGNLTAVTNPLGQTTALAYDAVGQPASITDPLGNRTTFEYDAAGNLVATVDPLGHRTQRAYDAVSRLLAVTDPRGFTTRIEYDALNRVTQLTDAVEGLTAFAYDPNGNLVAATDAEGRTTTYAYDDLDRLASRTDALGRQETYRYDAAGNLAQHTDRKGQVAVFAYDALNRPAGAGYQGDSGSTAFAYDAAGRLVRATDSAAGSIEFTYDLLDRLIQETTPQGTVAYQYDALGRRTAMTANGRAPVAYEYDGAGRLARVAQDLHAVGLAYDEAGRRVSLSRSNGTSTVYGYDAASRLLSILHQGPTGLIESLAYSYDAAGNRIGLTRSGGAATLMPPAVQAAYDAANQLVRFNAPAGSGETPNLAYDANGNLVSRTDAAGTTTYAWDARNRLVAVTGPGFLAEFAYDALGRRVRKTLNGVTTEYLYDGRDIVQELGGGTVGASYLRSLTLDEPFLRDAGVTSEAYHADALGSIVALTDGSGALATSYAYEPFGRTRVTGASDSPFGFTGRERDGVDQYFYRARHYSTGMARFLSPDPLNLARVLLARQASGGLPVDRLRRRALLRPLALNEYLYTEDNPVTFTDPEGLMRGIFPGLSGGTGEAIGGVAGAVTGGLAGRAVGAEIGMEIGFRVGGALGLGAGPLGSLGGAVVGGVVGQVVGGFVGGIIGGQIGGAIGGQFDDPCAGSLNCGEDELIGKRKR